MRSPQDRPPEQAAGAYAGAHPLRSLADPQWRTLWFAGHAWNIAFWVELIILTWLALELTGSAFQVGLVGTLRFLPQPLVGLYAGIQADRFPKRRLLIVAQVFNLVSTLTMLGLLAAGITEMTFVYGAALLTGTGWAIDFPVRRAYIRELLPERALVNAMSLDAASLVAMVMLGRWLAGGLLVLEGPLAGYVVLSVFYLLGMGLLLRLPTIPPAGAGQGRETVLQGLWEGVRFVWSHQTLRGVFLIAFIANLMLLPYFSFAPVFAKEVFGVGEGLLGLMSGMDGAGALVGTVLLAATASVRRRGVLFFAGASVMGLGITLYAFSSSFWLALPLLAMAGFGLSGFATMQTTLTVSMAPPDMRGRAMGVMMVGQGVLTLGLLWVGFLAEHIGIQAAVGLNALIGVGLILLTALALPALRRA